MPQGNYELVELEQEGDTFTLGGKKVRATPMLTEMKISVPTCIPVTDISNYIKKEAKFLADCNTSALTEVNGLVTKLGIVIREPREKGGYHTYRFYKVSKPTRTAITRSDGAELAIDLFGE